MNGGGAVLQLYTCQEIAERYRVEVITVWDWIRKKKLPAIKIGRDYRVSDRDIEYFESTRKTVHPPIK
ncbi:helix-turn-helix domain-containing protein [Hydrogeniiclostridium mannosilyticum]|uniref:helix-turn-helix domain-containing protein n=1 Tax=Hydrogeniiclostridium mannosilyticum TaxID=2764322 RepID=UPI002E8E6010|nr:helix-turn-helix domain-containing protein [Hydrogeniiclostridium mannosilyticum]